MKFIDADENKFEKKIQKFQTKNKLTFSRETEASHTISIISIEVVQ